VIAPPFKKDPHEGMLAFHTCRDPKVGQEGGPIPLSDAVAATAIKSMALMPVSGDLFSFIGELDGTQTTHGEEPTQTK
jgi:hypothetical protein